MIPACICPHSSDPSDVQGIWLSGPSIHLFSLLLSPGDGGVSGNRSRTGTSCVSGPRSDPLAAHGLASAAGWGAQGHPHLPWQPWVSHAFKGGASTARLQVAPCPAAEPWGQTSAPPQALLAQLLSGHTDRPWEAPGPRGLGVDQARIIPRGPSPSAGHGLPAA